ncbi:YdeI/OmpD-associated family protein [Tropicibacter oceani]|uniref:YdeI/OmpD-associated family protein n=1 Tax=Tropicibacter oceani TaxID=3058420 RepID=A0ABY8QL43_9RHOB|nr:YdeI/OmpD-associated family protein [Tropicibacter oceani]WGW05355.1 YdeI/OmpD-associated family protein [Tropicibacter oceani]
MITDPKAFFTKGCGRCDRFDTPACSAMVWGAGLAALRQLCLDAGLEETAKWGHPVYMHAGRNIAILGAFRGDFRLTFFNAALMKDPQGVLERQGPNTQNPGMIRFEQAAQVADKAPIITAYLAEAMGYAEAGLKPPKVETTLDLPDELVEALDGDPELAEAFHALTPGRQKSYVINLNGAKKPETRRSRIAAFRGKILAGKGATER